MSLRYTMGCRLIVIGLLMSTLLGVGSCNVPWINPNADLTQESFVKFFGGITQDTIVEVGLANTYYAVLGTSYPNERAVVSMIQVDLTGNQMVWNRWFPPTSTELGGDAQAAFLQGLSDSTWIVGINHTDTLNMHSTWLVKLDAQFNIVHEVTLTTQRTFAKWDVLEAAHLLADGSLLLGGYSTEIDSLKFESGLTEDTDMTDGWVVKVDADLNIVWERRYGFTGTDKVVALSSTGTEPYLLMQTQYPAGGDNRTWMLVRLNEEGYLLDQAVFESTSSLSTGTRDLTPRALTRSSTGDWLVAYRQGNGNGRLYRVDDALQTFERLGSSVEMSGPADIALSAEGNIWVSGLNEDRTLVQAWGFDATGNNLSTDMALINAGAPNSTNLNHRAGPIHVLPNGDILLGATLDWGNEISMITLIRNTPNIQTIQ